MPKWGASFLAEGFLHGINCFASGGLWLKSVPFFMKVQHIAQTLCQLLRVFHVTVICRCYCIVLLHRILKWILALKFEIIVRKYSAQRVAEICVMTDMCYTSSVANFFKNNLKPVSLNIFFSFFGSQELKEREKKFPLPSLTQFFYQ